MLSNSYGLAVYPFITYLAFSVVNELLVGNIYHVTIQVMHYIQTQH